ncbi:MAG: succinate dehydrogenase assembly factor 2 [Betaproteobacteria bacterium]|nr:succinate dehydrogenase assembly factor 2 [Betaproteobacteria bacterium]
MGERDRIRWHCRRGMLELDLLLQAFLDRHFEHLSAQELAILTELLEYPDNDLLDLVTRRAEPCEERLSLLLNLIRES